MPLRRDPPADPEAAARVAALLRQASAPRPAHGWVPTSRPHGARPWAYGDAAPDPAPARKGPEDVEAYEADAGDREVADQPLGAQWSDGEGVPRGRHGAPGAGGVLDRWRAARVDPGRRGVAALSVVALLAAVLAGAVFLRGRPVEVVPPPVVASGVPVPGSSSGPTATTGAAPAPSPGASPAHDVVVSVVGKVRRPGLVRLPAGSRVDDAVRAAGGVQPRVDLTLLNLARPLVDGEQVAVGVALPAAPAGSAPGPAGAAAPGPGAGADAVLDLNAATVDQLDELPGVGPVLAQRIVDWRTANGRFASVDQLREVSGIGESKYADLESRVRV